MTLTDVVVYGLIFMVPLAPVGVFGAIFNFSHGMTALIYLVAGIAMFFSAVSYKEMAKEYPVAGSVYSYVRLGTTKLVGFLSGWADPPRLSPPAGALCILGASAMGALMPEVPGWMWVIGFIAVVAFINLRGIVVTARMNMIFLIIQGARSSCSSAEPCSDHPRTGSVQPCPLLSARTSLGSSCSPPSPSQRLAISALMRFPRSMKKPKVGGRRFRRPP